MHPLCPLEIHIPSTAPLGTLDIREEALEATKPPSVTRAEADEDLRGWARGRAVPAS